MKQFSLVGVDGNAFSIMAYTSSAMKKAGFKEQIAEYRNQAMSGDYSNLICLSDEWITKCNEALGLEQDEDDWSEDY